MVAHNESFVCPTCQSALTQSVECLRCDACDSNYELDRHIPIFTELGDAEDLEEMVELVALAKSQHQNSADRVREIFRLPNRPNNKARFRTEAKAFEFFDEKAPQPQNLKILNISCGIGREASLLIDRGVTDLTILDISSPAILYADKHLRECFPSLKLTSVVSDASLLPFKDNEFDLVFVYGSAHHYEAFETFIEQALRVSKKLIILSEPAMMGSLQGMFNTLGWNTEYGGVDTHRIDEHQVMQICSKHGYRFSSARVSQYYPKILDRLGDNPIAITLWFGFLSFLDVVLPKSMRHSLSFQVESTVRPPA